MRVPEQLKAAALAEFQRGGNWQEFLAEHREGLLQVEPYDRAKYHGLRDAVRCIVVSGEVSGLYGVGDPDALNPWVVDDGAHQPDDVTTRAQFDPLPTQQSSWRVGRT